MSNPHASNDRVYSRSFLTRMKVAEALNRLCEDYPFDKIRIENIVQESGVSRSNFYHNFEDKNAVVTWLGNQYQEEGIFRIGRDLSWLEGYLITTRKMSAFANLFNKAENSSDYDAAVPFFIRSRQKNLRETLCEYQKKPLTAQLAFEIEAFPMCEVVMSSQLRRGKLGCTAEEFAQHLVAMTPPALHEALKTPVDALTMNHFLDNELHR